MTKRLPKLAPVGEDRRKDLADLGGPEPQEPVPGPAAKACRMRSARRRLQLGRVVRGREHEAAVRRQAGGQAIGLRHVRCPCDLVL